MRRTASALLAVVSILSIAVLLSKRLPAPAANGQARRCEVPAEPPRPLHLDRFADRAHLRAEAATAESWAMAYADVSPARRQGLGLYREVHEHCMATLFARISQTHLIDVGTVREYAQQRDILFDTAVLLVFFVAYLLTSYQIVGVVLYRFSQDERFALAAALIIVSVVTVIVAMVIGDLWSVGAEMFRVGNGHLGDRTERVLWRQHGSAITATAFGVFWLVAALRARMERGQGDLP